MQLKQNELQRRNKQTKNKLIQKVMNKIQRLASRFAFRFVEMEGLEEFKKLNLIHHKDELAETTDSLTQEEVNDVILHLGAIIIAVHNKDEAVLATLTKYDAIHAAKGN